MTRSFSTVAFSGLFSWLALAPSASFAETCSFSMGWEDWAPFSVAGVDGPEGLDIEVASEIAKVTGCNVRFQEVAWSRHLVMVERGEIDLALGATRTAEREVYAHFLQPYRTEAVHLFFRDGDPDRSVEEILQAGGTIGYTLNYELGDTLNATMQQFPANFDGVTEHRLNLIKLARGRMTASLDDIYAGVQGARDDGLAIYPSSQPSFATDIHIMVSRKTDPEVLRIINEGLNELRRSGRLSSLLSKYMNISTVQ